MLCVVALVLWYGRYDIVYNKLGHSPRNILLSFLYRKCQSWAFYLNWINKCRILHLLEFFQGYWLDWPYPSITLKWRHNERDGVPNHQPHDCLLNRLFRHRSKKTSKLRVTGLCVDNSPVNVEFHAQRASNAENVSIWLRHHDLSIYATVPCSHASFSNLTLMKTVLGTFCWHIYVPCQIKSKKKIGILKYISLFRYRTS